MDKTLKQLKEKLGIIKDLQHAAALLDWDQQTYMPPGSIEARSQQLSTLQSMAHDMFIDDSIGEWLDELNNHIDNLEEDDQALVRVTLREYNQQKRIPSSVIEELSKTTSMGISVWIEARKKNDFQMFLPHLKKIIDLNRKIADYLGYQNHPYDALLDQYEPGIITKDIDSLFEKLGNALAKLSQSFGDLGQFKNRFDGNYYPKEKQLMFGTHIIRELGYDLETGRIDQSAHPFTTSFTSKDVRITTRISESDFRPCFFGLVHEAGHGIYEQHIPFVFSRTPLGDAASLGFHESQSRFFENIIARNPSFWMKIYPDFLEAFPEARQAGNISDLVKYVNAVQPSLIRVEADEVTYNLHIVIRYQLEKELIKGTMSPEHLPEQWAELYQKYLNIKPDSDSNGVLQDIHWAAGIFGYFPTYTLGNLYSAHLLKMVEQEISPISQIIERGNYSALVDWFNTHLYSKGKKQLPTELLKHICRCELSEQPFLKYLEGKYSSINSM
ncbi:MAG: carboxypeptidase M32 [Calditrichia bacterium]